MTENKSGHQMHLIFTLTELCSQNRPPSETVKSSGSVWNTVYGRLDCHRVCRRWALSDQHKLEWPPHWPTSNRRHSLYYLSPAAPLKSGDVGGVHGMEALHIMCKKVTAVSKERWWEQSLGYSLDYFCWFQGRLVEQEP